MDAKLLSTIIASGVSLLALAASISAQFESHDAQAVAARLERQQSESQTTIKILDRALREVRSDDLTSRQMTCSYLAVLSKMEQTTMEAEPFVTTDFLRQLARPVALTKHCIFEVENARAIQTRGMKNTPPNAVRATAPPADAAKRHQREYPDNLGGWPALIASCSATNCAAARDDFTEFAALLVGTVASGHPIHVVGAENTGYPAVTVDAGGDRELALEIRDPIQLAAATSSDRKIARDSFVVGARTWFIDDNGGADEIVR